MRWNNIFLFAKNCCRCLENGPVEVRTEGVNEYPDAIGKSYSVEIKTNYGDAISDDFRIERDDIEYTSFDPVKAVIENIEIYLKGIDDKLKIEKEDNGSGGRFRNLKLIISKN